MKRTELSKAIAYIKRRITKEYPSLADCDVAISYATTNNGHTIREVKLTRNGEQVKLSPIDSFSILEISLDASHLYNY